MQRLLSCDLRSGRAGDKRVYDLFAAEAQADGIAVKFMYVRNAIIYVGHAGAADSPDILDLEPATHRQSPGCEAVVEDAELLARISAGEQQALELLHERFATGMYSVAMRVTRSERLSQEAVQDAFMAVWQDPLRFDPARGSLGPWLFTLARFKAIDAVRREAAVKRQTAEVDLELYEAPDNVHDEVWRGLRRERLNTAINLLPEDQRRALSLAFIQGLTHVEVAEREGIPLGTAKTRIRTALLRLRASLETDLSEVESTGESPGDGGIPRGVPGPADRMRARGDAAGRTRSGLARCAIRFGSVIEQALKLTRFVTAPFGAGLTAAAGGSI